MRLSEGDRAVFEEMRETVIARSENQQLAHNWRENCVVLNLSDVSVPAHLREEDGLDAYAPRVIVAPFNKPHRGNGVWVRSIDHKDKVGGAKLSAFRLPDMPLDENDPVYRSISRDFPHGVPAVGIKTWCNAAGNFGVYTHAHSSQFTYERIMPGNVSGLREELSGRSAAMQGHGRIEMTGFGQSPQTFRKGLADRFEHQLFEGTMEMVRVLMDRAFTDQPVYWSEAMDEVCARVAERRAQLEKRNAPIQGGGPRGEALLRGPHF